MESEPKTTERCRPGGITCRITDAACSGKSPEELRRIREELEQAAGEWADRRRWSGNRSAGACPDP